MLTIINSVRSTMSNLHNEKEIFKKKYFFPEDTTYMQLVCRIAQN